MSTLNGKSVASTYDQVVKRQDSYSATGNQIEIMDDSGVIKTTPLYLDSVNSRVGIGTTSPSSLLHIQSTGDTVLRVAGLGVRTDTNTPSARIMLDGKLSSGNASSGDTPAFILVAGTDAAGSDGNLTQIEFETTTATAGAVESSVIFNTVQGAAIGTMTEAMRIEGGNVGIGATPTNYYSGADNFVIKQASGEGGMSIVTANDTSGAIYFADGTTGDLQYRGGIGYTHTTDKLFFVSGGSAKAWIDTDGNVGIGTSSPAGNLEVQNVSGVADIIIDSNTGSDSVLRFYEEGVQQWSILQDSNDSNKLKFYGNSDYRLTIDQDGDVGIGTTSPAYNLDVTDASGPVSFHLGGIASTTGATINITNNAAKQYSANKNKHVINFITHIDGNITDGGYAQMEVGHSASGQDGTFIQFSTTPNAGALAERMRIDDAGDVTVSTGDIVFGTAGKGIVLGATSNTDANTLDDYEEGTWTPTFNEQTAGTGTYTKVGRLVTIQGRVIADANGTTAGALAMAGLPFTADITGSFGLTLSMENVNASATGNNISAPFNGQMFYMYDNIVRATSTAGNPYYNYNLLIIGTRIYISGSYETTL